MSDAVFDPVLSSDTGVYCRCFYIQSNSISAVSVLAHFPPWQQSTGLLILLVPIIFTCTYLHADCPWDVRPLLFFVEVLFQNTYRRGRVTAQNFWPVSISAIVNMAQRLRAQSPIVSV